MALPQIARLSLATTPPVGVALVRPRNRLYQATARLASLVQPATPALVLTTCGGFFCFPWPRVFHWSDNVNPGADDRLELEKAAEHHLWQLLTPDLVRELALLTRFISIGADSTTTRHGRCYRCELVAVVNLRTREVRWTGKYYPTGPYQMRQLYRCPELESHFLSLNRHRTMVLGCHDLNLFSPRGMAVTAPGSIRAEWRASFLAEANRFAPSLVLHHPHTTQSPRVWLQAVHHLQRELPSVRQFISGLNIYPVSRQNRSMLYAIQKATQLGPNILEV
jgi:hypothetical protein